MSDTPYVNWGALWATDQNDSDWLYQDILARGRGHAFYAPHKVGKSLLKLWMAAKLATGPEKVVVIYLDYEMTEDDLRERLEDMGYGPDSDLSRLRYALLPSLPPLDTRPGGEALLALVDEATADYPGHHIVVTIDTIGRAVRGEENSADTIRAFYRATGMQLKQRGVTWARLDHAGKDVSAGQRGSSGKGDDVDVIWRLEKTDSGLTLHRDAARMRWVPEKVTLQMAESPLRFTQVGMAWPAGTKEVAGWLDKLGVDLDASSRTATMALRAKGHKARRQVLLAALRYRREAEMERLLKGSGTTGTTPGTTPDETGGNHPRNHPEENPSDQHGNQSGTTGNHHPSPNGNQGGYPVGNPLFPGPAGDQLEEDQECCRLGCKEPAAGNSKHGVPLCQQHLEASAR